MTEKTQTDYVLGCFENIAEAVEITRIPEHNWRNWQRSGRISQQQHLNIIVRARKAGKTISPADFYAHLVDGLIASAADSMKKEAAGAVPVT